MRPLQSSSFAVAIWGPARGAGLKIHPPNSADSKGCTRGRGACTRACRVETLLDACTGVDQASTRHAPVRAPHQHRAYFSDSTKYVPEYIVQIVLKLLRTERRTVWG